MNIKNYKNIQLQTCIEDVAKPVSNSKQKYMVLLVAGQSNAVGYDESYIEGDMRYLKEDRIMQLGFKGDDNLKIVNLGHCAQNFQDISNLATLGGTGPSGIHMPLCKLLLNHIPNDYKILVLPCAYGGTGFNSGDAGTYDSNTMRPSAGNLKWSKISPFYLAMRDRLKYVLDMNFENKCLGVLWCQGENDKNNVITHRSGFTDMYNDFNVFFDSYKNQFSKCDKISNNWYFLATVNYWYEKINNVAVSSVWQTYKDLVTANGGGYINATFDNNNRPLDSNEVDGTGATSSTRASHFGNSSYFKIANKVIDEWRIREILPKYKSLVDIYSKLNKFSLCKDNLIGKMRCYLPLDKQDDITTNEATNIQLKAGITVTKLGNFNVESMMVDGYYGIGNYTSYGIRGTITQANKLIIRSTTDYYTKPYGLAITAKMAPGAILNNVLNIIIGGNSISGALFMLSYSKNQVKDSKCYPRCSYHFGPDPSVGASGSDATFNNIGLLEKFEVERSHRYYLSVDSVSNICKFYIDSIHINSYKFKIPPNEYKDIIINSISPTATTKTDGFNGHMRDLCLYQYVSPDEALADFSVFYCKL